MRRTRGSEIELSFGQGQAISARLAMLYLA